MGHGQLFACSTTSPAALLSALAHGKSRPPIRQFRRLALLGRIAGVMGGYSCCTQSQSRHLINLYSCSCPYLSHPAMDLLGACVLGMAVFRARRLTPPVGGVAYWAHAGGFIVGMVLTIPLWLRVGWAKKFWSTRDGHRAAPQANAIRKCQPMPKGKNHANDRQQPTPGCHCGQVSPQHSQPYRRVGLCHALHLFLLPRPRGNRPSRQSHSALKVTKGREHLTSNTWAPITAKHYSVRLAALYVTTSDDPTRPQCGVNLGCNRRGYALDAGTIPYSDGINHPVR